MRVDLSVYFITAKRSEIQYNKQSGSVIKTYRWEGNVLGVEFKVEFHDSCKKEECEQM